MPTLYHGTSRPFAIAMAGTGPPGVAPAGAIDVSVGGGEFGRGFYTQGSSSNAARRGLTIYGNNHAVLVLNIADQPYYALRFKRLTLNMAQMLNKRLKSTGRKTYTTTHDVVVGPLVYQPTIQQQKFQSQDAQILLNGP